MTMTGPGPKRFYQPITMQLSNTHSISAHAFLIIDSQSNSQQHIYFPIKLEHLGETLETHLPLLPAWPPPLPLRSKAALLSREVGLEHHVEIEHPRDPAHPSSCARLPDPPSQIHDTLSLPLSSSRLLPPWDPKH